MPMDSARASAVPGAPEPTTASRTARRRAKPARTTASSGEFAPIVMKPARRSPSSAATAVARAGASSGRTPDFDSSPETLTWTRTSSTRPSRAQRAASDSASASESTLSTPVAVARTWLTLLRWRWPIMWTSTRPAATRSARSGAFATSSWTRFSPMRSAPASTTARTAAAGWVFVATSSRTSDAARPAARARGPPGSAPGRGSARSARAARTTARRGHAASLGRPHGPGSGSSQGGPRSARPPDRREWWGKDGAVKTLLNIIWLVFAGLWLALGYVVAGSSAAS